VKAEISDYFPVTRTGQPPADDLYRDEVYRGGALVFHVLRLKIGDEAFSRRCELIWTSTVTAMQEQMNSSQSPKQVSGQISRLSSMPGFHRQNCPKCLNR